MPEIIIGGSEPSSSSLLSKAGISAVIEREGRDATGAG